MEIRFGKEDDDDEQASGTPEGTSLRLSYVIP